VQVSWLSLNIIYKTYRTISFRQGNRALYPVLLFFEAFCVSLVVAIALISAKVRILPQNSQLIDLSIWCLFIFEFFQANAKSKPNNFFATGAFSIFPISRFGVFLLRLFLFITDYRWILYALPLVMLVAYFLIGGHFVMVFAAIFVYSIAYIWMSVVFLTILLFLKTLFARFGEVNASILVAFFSILLFSLIINTRFLPYFTGSPLLVLIRDALSCMLIGNLSCSIYNALVMLIGVLAGGLMVLLISKIRLSFRRRCVTD